MAWVRASALLVEFAQRPEVHTDRLLQPKTTLLVASPQFCGPLLSFLFLNMYVRVRLDIAPSYVAQVFITLAFGTGEGELPRLSDTVRLLTRPLRRGWDVCPLPRPLPARARGPGRRPHAHGRKQQGQVHLLLSTPYLGPVEVAAPSLGMCGYQGLSSRY